MKFYNLGEIPYPASGLHLDFGLGQSNVARESLNLGNLAGSQNYPDQFVSLFPSQPGSPG